jgi:ABC-type lipoprotein export system ATPase subunit
VTAVLALSGISKDYRGLRPLRLEHLVLERGDQVAIVGIDQPAAETLINLITGASLPDRGAVTVFGRPTASILDGATWLELVDRFGIATDRAVLLGELSTVQNLAVPFSLDLEPVPDEIRQEAELLAREVGLEDHLLDVPVNALEGDTRARVRLARALALDPAVLLLEHPTATVPASETTRFGRDVRQIAGRRGLTTLTLTADARFARAAADSVLTFHPATGRLTRGRFW